MQLISTALTTPRPLFAAGALSLALLILAACGFASASQSIPDNVQPTIIEVGITPDGDRFLLVGTLEHGTFVSFNDGEEWTQSEGLPGEPQYDWIEPAVLDIEIAPDGVTAFAATAAGLFKSTDSGRTWVRFTRNHTTYELEIVKEVSIAPDFAESGLVAIIADSNVGGGPFVSTDAGSSWTPAPGHAGGGDVQVLDDDRLAIASNRTITIRTASNPGAIAYRTESERTPSGGVYRSSFSPSFSEDGLFFYGGARWGTMHRMNLTTGEQIDSGLRIAGRNHHCDADVDWGGYGSSPWCWLEAAYLSPNFASDGAGFVISTDGLARTTDSGFIWELIDGLPPDSEPIESIAFSPDFADSGLVYAVTQRRLLKSSDGGATWQAFPSLEELPPIPTSTPQPTPTPRLTPFPTPTAAPNPGP